MPEEPTIQENEVFDEREEIKAAKLSSDDIMQVITRDQNAY